MVSYRREEKPSKFDKTILFISKYKYFFITVLFIAWCMFFKMIYPGYVGVVIDMLGDSKGVAAGDMNVGSTPG